MVENPDLTALLAFADTGQAGAMASNPLLQTLGAALEDYDEKRQSLTLSFRPTELFRQGNGVIQGGAQSAMLDFALAFVAMITVRSNVASASMSTDFLAACKGENLTAVAEIEKAGRKMIFARAGLWDGARKVSVASASMMVL